MSGDPGLQRDVRDFLESVGAPPPDLADRAFRRLWDGNESRSPVPSWFGLVAALLAALVVLSLVAIRNGQLLSSRQPAATPKPEISAVVPPPAATPSGTPSSPPSSWVVERLPLGVVSAMAIDTSCVYALVEPIPTRGGVAMDQVKVAAVDRHSGVVRTAGPFPYMGHIALAGGWVWLGGGDVSHGGSAPTLYRLDPRTLALVQRVDLPAASSTSSGLLALGQLAGSQSQLWVAYGTTLELRNPATGVRVAHYSLPSAATSISLDPTGSLLYAGVAGDAQSRAQILQWDTPTGHQLAAAATGGLGLGGPSVAAARDGVWVTYATGMMGAINHLSANGLVEIPTVAEVGHSNGVRVSVASSGVWVTDGGARTIACLDPQQGSIRASTDETFPDLVVGDADGTYLGTGDGLAILRPDPKCQA